MTLVGEMAFGLVARTEKLESGIRKAKAEIKSLQDYAGIALKSVGFAITGLASFETVRSLMGEIKDQIGDIDALATQALKLGTTARDLDALHFAVDMLDGNIASFDQSLLKMQKNLYEASQGAKEQSEAFRDLNLSVSELLQKSATDQFSSVITAMAGIKNETEQAALAMRVFGRAGADLIPIIRSNLIAFEQLKAEAIVLNGALGDTSAVERNDDAMKRLDYTWKNFKRTAAANDTVMGLAENWLDGTSRILNGIDNLVNPSGKGVQQRVTEAMADAMLTDEAKKFADHQRQLAKIRDMEAEIARINETGRLGGSVGSIHGDESIVRANERIDFLSKEIQKLKELSAEYGRQQAAIKQARSAETFLEEWRASLNRVNTPFTDFVKSAMESVEDLGDGVGDMYHRIVREADVAAEHIRQGWDAQHREMMENLKAEADAIRRQIMTPAEQLEEEQARILELVRRGVLAAADAEKYLIQRAATDLPGTPDPASATLARSSEAENNITRAIARAQDKGNTAKDKVNEDIRTAVKKAAAEAEKQTAELKTISSKLNISYANLN